MNISSLENGAVEISDIDIRNLGRKDYEFIKNILRKEVVVLIRNQSIKALDFAKLVQEISKAEIANWKELNTDENGEWIEPFKDYPDPFKWDESIPYPVQKVTAEKKDNEYLGIFPKGKLDWHANLNGPKKADGVALQGIRSVEGTRTSFMNSALAYQQMPEDLKRRIQNVYCEYYYDQTNWADIGSQKQIDWALSNRLKYAMWIVQENIIGTKGTYFYFNNNAKVVNGDKNLENDLYDYLMQEKHIYHHDWQVGDIILMDQLLSLHKRRIETDEVFEKRVLHRYTFRITGYGNPNKILEKNNFEINY